MWNAMCSSTRSDATLSSILSACMREAVQSKIWKDIFPKNLKDNQAFFHPNLSPNTIQFHLVWFYGIETRSCYVFPLTWSLKTISTQMNSFVILAKVPLQSWGVFLYCKAGRPPWRVRQFKESAKVVTPANYKSVLSSYLSDLFPQFPYCILIQV